MNSKECIFCGRLFSKSGLNNILDYEYGFEGSFDFLICNSCQVLVLDPMPTLDDLKTYYPPNYHGFSTFNGGIISFLYHFIYKLRIKKYLKYLPKGGRLLDVGCADAPYFDLLKKCLSSVDLVGVEFKDEIAKKAREKGRNIITGTIDDLNISKKFDLIIMNNLIEHVLDPISELNKSSELLKENGYIILETPNFNSWDFKIAKSFWGGLHVPRHTFLFSRKSFLNLASRTNFKIVKINYLLETSHWALSVQNYLQSTKFFSTKIKNGRVWYYKFLLFVFIPLNLLQKLFQKTGSFEIVLQKKV